mgnify:FL=1
MLKIPENSDLRLDKDRRSIVRFKRSSALMRGIAAANRAYFSDATPLLQSPTPKNVIDARERFADRAAPKFQAVYYLGQVSSQPSHVQLHAGEPGVEKSSGVGA